MRRLLALLLCSLLAGCSGSTSTEADAGPGDACVVTDAADSTCAEEALNATAQGGSARPHLHDYWDGQTRIALEDVSGQGSPVLCTAAAPVIVLKPADGDAVIQGTGTVEVTLTFDAQAPTQLPATFELWVKTAAMQAAEPFGPATSGAMVAYATNDTANDLPHQRLSAWEFQLVARPANPSGCFSYMGQATLHVELVRGPQEIPLYPGHVDRWQNRTSLPLLERDGTVTFYLGGQANLCLSAECIWTAIRPDPNAVVPFDAQEVLVSVAAADASPLRLRLAYHDATTREYTVAEPETASDTLRTYVIPVGDGGDGPYASQSQWEFFLLPDNEANVYSGSYTMTAEAVRDPVL